MNKPQFACCVAKPDFNAAAIEQIMDQSIRITTIHVSLSLSSSVCPALCLRLLMPEHKSPKMYDALPVWSAGGQHQMHVGVAGVLSTEERVDCSTANCNCTTPRYPAICCSRWRIYIIILRKKKCLLAFSSTSSALHLRMIYRSVLDYTLLVLRLLYRSLFDSVLVNYTFFVNSAKGISRFTASCDVKWIMIYRLCFWFIFRNAWNDFMDFGFHKWSKLLLVLKIFLVFFFLIILLTALGWL